MEEHPRFDDHCGDKSVLWFGLQLVNRRPEASDSASVFFGLFDAAVAHEEGQDAHCDEEEAYDQ